MTGALRPHLHRVAAVALAVAAAIAILFASAGFFDTDPLHVFPPRGPRRPIGVVYFSGDMGLRYGMGGPTATALAAHGIAVLGVQSSTLFAGRHDRDYVDGVVADAVREGLATTGTQRLVLIGQSYGADILQTGLAALPADLRTRIAGVVLIVPGDSVYFRADPSGLAYRGPPDSVATTTAATIDWAPLTCIHGRAETDSLCPNLQMSNLRMAKLHVVAMPGGHFLHRDSAALATRVLAAVTAASDPKDS